MKKRLFVLVLALAVVFTFSAVPGFAASKHVVQVSEKTYNIDENGKEEFSNSWKDTYKNGKMVGYTSKYVDFNYEWDEETGESIETKEVTEYENTYKYKNGRHTATYVKENGKKSKKTVFTYKNKKLSKITSYNYKNGKYVTDYTAKYTYGKNKETVLYTYKNNPLYKTLKEVTTLDSKGRTKTIVSYEDGKKAYTQKYEYHSNGSLAKTTYKSTDGSYSSVDTYNKKGLLTKEVSTYEDSKTVNEYKYYTSGLTKQRIETYTYKDYEGNEQTDVTKYTYKYSNYYGSGKKYPKTVKIYRNGEYYQKETRGYKKI